MPQGDGEIELQPGPYRPVVRIGDTVRRVAGWWTAAVHDLLAHLDRVGFDAAPKPLGVDEDGREIVSYIPGDSGRGEVHRVEPDDGLRAVARALRSYHDAVAGYRPPNGAEWAIGAVPMRAGDIVCHGDFNPWNLVWRGTEIVGVLDWDLAHPGPPLDDVAFTLVYSVPFRPDGPPAPRHRIEVFADAYGIGADGLVDAAIERQWKYARHIRVLHDRGFDVPWTNTGSIRMAEDWARWCDEHRRLFE